jgi:DNA-binding transcriptional ArsR family regulator
MTKKYLLFNLEDDKAKVLGEVISNPTCKKIVNYISEVNDVSESEIAKALKLPANTVNYNVKRLLDSGLIEQTKKFFWSSKGKKIQTYRVANKLIVLSPKSNSNIYDKLKGVIPVVLISGILSVFVGWYYNTKVFALKTLDYGGNLAGDRIYDASEKGSSAIMQTVPSVPQIILQQPVVTPIEISVWFFVGAMVALTAYMVWNWKRV